MSGLVRCAMLFNAPNTVSNVCVVTAHFNMTLANTPSDSDVDATTQLLADWWTTGLDGEVSLRSLTSSLCTLDTITGQKLQPTPAAAVRSRSVATAGTVTGTMLPSQVAVVLSLRTALSGRRYRGRMYIPGISAGSITTSGLLVSATRQAYADCADGMRRAAENLYSSDGELCVYSRVADHKEKVTQIRVGDKLDTQRRRKIPTESYVIGS